MQWSTGQPSLTVLSHCASLFPGDKNRITHGASGVLHFAVGGGKKSKEVGREIVFLASAEAYRLGRRLRCPAGGALRHVQVLRARP